MACELIKRANQKQNINMRIGVDVHCLWCIDHRLNLVTQDFKEVPGINFVITFAKWLTANDRLVSYTLFARRTLKTKLKKIPPPSETRWLFLRDTLNVLLEQTQTIDSFLNINKNMSKWREHISSSKCNLGPIKDIPFSLQHPLIKAHFQFAKEIFAVLGNINEVFQGKYGFIHHFSEYMVPFYQLMKYELEKSENGDFTTYPFLGKVERKEIPQFTTILKSLILNLRVRFDSVSFSLVKKNVKSF